MLSVAEQSALAVFRSFMVRAGQMVCFPAPQLEKHRATLQRLTEKNLVVREQFAGGYSLTPNGFAAMMDGVRAARKVASPPSAVAQSAARPAAARSAAPRQAAPKQVAAKRVPSKPGASSRRTPNKPR
jgi:hypothetical protein